MQRIQIRLYISILKTFQTSRVYGPDSDRIHYGPRQRWLLAPREAACVRVAAAGACVSAPTAKHFSV